MRLFGGSIGVAASFIVLNTKIQNALSNLLSPEQLNDFYKSPTAMISFTALQKLKVRETYIDAFAINMRICIGISAASFLASLCAYQRNPPSVRKFVGELETTHTQSATESGTLEA